MDDGDDDGIIRVMTNGATCSEKIANTLAGAFARVLQRLIADDQQFMLATCLQATWKVSFCC